MKGIQLDHDTGDLLVENGGLVIDDNRSQLTEHIVRAYPGEFKEAPTLGAYVERLLGGNYDPFWTGDTMEMLHSQGLDVQKIDITENSITIN
ncbi:MAG: hypothetical protein FWH39_01595 [Bacteroidales bacterium]|nr:hypothetical protein [Bacteroidales bacterium]